MQRSLTDSQGRCEILKTRQCIGRQTSDHSPRSSKTKLVHVELSNHHLPKEDSVGLWCDQLKKQLFQSEQFANEDADFVPADVATVIYPSEEHAPRVREPRQLAWHSNGTSDICWTLVVQGTSLLRNSNLRTQANQCSGSPPKITLPARTV